MTDYFVINQEKLSILFYSNHSISFYFKRVSSAHRVYFLM